MEKPFSLKFPMGGLDKSKGYSAQPPYSTWKSVNVWPSDWTEGRERGGTRPKAVVLSGFSTGGTPLNWTDVTFVPTSTSGVANSGIKRGVAVTTTTGVHLHTHNGSTYDGNRIPVTNSGFASSAMFLNTLYHANTGTDVKFYTWGSGLVDNNNTPSDPSDDFIQVIGAGNLTVKASVFDSEDPPNLLESYGAVPTNCGIVLSHGGRLWLAGDTNNPQVLYASRVGDSQDWDYSAIDAGAAWANSGGVEGRISEPITSLFTHMSNSCMIVGCTDSCYVVNGNPRIGSGGHVRSISQSVGPLMQSAICKVGDDRTFFFSRVGLQVIRPGCGEPPTPLSTDRLPMDLVGLSPEDGDRVSIGYDALHKGIHIYAQSGLNAAYDASTGLASYDREVYWFYDLQNGGFWEMDFPYDIQLAVTYPAIMEQSKSGFLGVSGGKGYQFVGPTLSGIPSTAPDCDDDSYLWYGPFKLGSEHTEGILSEIYAVLGSTSGEVEYGIYTGETAEAALADPNPFIGTWKVKANADDQNQARSGLQYKSNPIKRGTMGFLKVSSLSSSGSFSKGSWSIEEIMCLRRAAGRRAYG